MRLGRLRRCSWELKFSPWPAKATCCTSLYNYHCCLIQLRICWGEPVSHIQWCSRLVEREQSCWGPEGELHVACTERPHTVFCKYNRPKTVFNFWKGSVSMQRYWKHCKVHIFWDCIKKKIELTTKVMSTKVGRLMQIFVPFSEYLNFTPKADRNSISFLYSKMQSLPADE